MKRQTKHVYKMILPITVTVNKQQTQTNCKLI